MSCKGWRVTANQLDLPSLTPLPIAGCGRLQLGAPPHPWCSQLHIYYLPVGYEHKLDVYLVFAPSRKALGMTSFPKLLAWLAFQNSWHDLPSKILGMTCLPKLLAWLAFQNSWRDLPSKTLGMTYLPKLLAWLTFQNSWRDLPSKTLGVTYLEKWKKTDEACTYYLIIVIENPDTLSTLPLMIKRNLDHMNLM